LVLALVAIVIITFVIYHAEPILQGRVMETLSTRFRGHVLVGASLWASARKLTNKADCA
jgi:hypothetical protein